MDSPDYSAHYQHAYGPLLIGAHLAHLDPLPPTPDDPTEWIALSIHQTTGTPGTYLLIPQRDPESNGPGHLIGGDGDTDTIWSLSHPHLPPDLVHQRITAIGALPAAICRLLDWPTSPYQPPPLQLLLENGQWLSVARDEELNGPGFWLPERADPQP